MKNAFTLIELFVVIAIIAMLKEGLTQTGTKIRLVV